MVFHTASMFTSFVDAVIGPRQRGMLTSRAGIRMEILDKRTCAVDWTSYIRRSQHLCGLEGLSVAGE